MKFLITSKIDIWIRMAGKVAAAVKELVTCDSPVNLNAVNGYHMQIITSIQSGRGIMRRLP